MGSAVIGSFGVFGFLFVVFLVILWTLLPFAVFGIKQRLDTQVKVLSDIHAELKRLNASDKPTTKPIEKPIYKPEVVVETRSNPEPEIQVPIADLYADPASKWFKKKAD